jgi:type VI secretion system protein ImpK
VAAAFDAPERSDQTVFRPNPGGRRPPAPAAAAPAVAGQKTTMVPRLSAVAVTELSAPSDEPIMRAAASLLLLLGRLRTALLRAPIGVLPAQIAEGIQKFEAEVRDAGVPADEINAAKYILCATADNVLANLPGEDRSAVLRSGLLSRFFGESADSRRLFEEIERAKSDPTTHYAILELEHACLALGFQGARIPLPASAGSVQDVQRDVFRAMQRVRPTPPRLLSPHWRGQALASHAVGLRVPVWAVAGVAALALFLIYVVLRTSLSGQTDTTAATLAGLTPNTPVAIARRAAVPPPAAVRPSAAQTSQLATIRQALGQEIEDGTLTVDATANQIIVRMTDRVLFQPGRATLLDDVHPVLASIARALESQKGDVKVIGHTDNRPVSNIRFATNFDLSVERARVVAADLKLAMSHPERIDFEGRGGDVPIASNDTPEGRNRNRRIEIVLPRTD